MIGCAGGAGCGSDLTAIDSKVDQLLRERADRLGGGTIAPARDWQHRVSDPGSRSELGRKAPGSTNPRAEDLSFSVADEGRDVAARLAAYQEQENDPSARKMALNDIFAQAQSTSREFLSAEEEYILAAIRLLIERHRFDIRLFHTATAQFNEFHTDGSRDLTLNLVNELSARKQLPFGGEVAARWIWSASENLRAAASGGYTQSSRIVLDANVPLLRGFGDVAQEGLIQAERDLVYAAREFEDFRRRFLVSLARDYFNLLQQQDGIASQQRQLESFIQLENRQRRWNEEGKLAQFEVNLATNNVLNARAGLANLTETYILSLDRFKVRLGIPVREAVVIDSSQLNVPEPDVTLDRATDLALEYRLDLQNRRDRLDDSKRSVLNAKNNLLPDLNLAGSLVIPTEEGAREGGVVYQTGDFDYTAGIRFDLPLDRQTERLQLRATTIALAQAQRGYDQFRDELILDVRGKTREIERARLNLLLAEERVKINYRRKDEQTLKEDEIDTQQKIDTENDIRDSERARDQAKADLRNAVLDYLLATGQLRVQRSGQFEPLPGMPSQLPNDPALAPVEAPKNAVVPTTEPPPPPTPDGQVPEVQPPGEMPLQSP